MLKCASVFTFEVDDPEAAYAEIATQLAQKLTLLEHTVGIIMCHSEFLASGVTQHVCAQLPFDLAGVTTASQAVNEAIGEQILTIFVLTSDDVRFVAGVTDSLSQTVDAPLDRVYKKLTAGLTEPPQLVLAFPPFGLRAGDDYVHAFEKLAPGAAVFGTLAIDDTATFEECETIYNGVNDREAMAFVLCFGPIKPRFLVATLPESSAVSSKAKITKATGNLVYEIDQQNALKYFEERQFAESCLYTPFYIDLLEREDYDGVPIVRGLASFTEEGAAVFHGEVDEGSTLTILRCETEDVVSTTRQAAALVNDFPEVNGALLFPCTVRRITLLGSGKPLLELQAAKDTLNDEIPYMIGYAGGEICPTSVKDGVPTNRFHNYSLVILVI